VYIITQNRWRTGRILNYIRAQYNRSAEHDPPFFQELVRSDKERAENYTTNFVARTLMPLDDVFEGLGDRIEKRRRTYTSWFSEKEFTDFAGSAGKWVRNRMRFRNSFIRTLVLKLSNCSPEQ